MVPRRSPSSALVESVASVRGREVESIQPLYEVVDPEALDELLIESGARVTEPVEIALNYDGFIVNIDSSGRLELHPAE
ncbi:HalOD1 output domain-containing protein [Haloarculaceae archaeon H-GB11]|nr:HalOD1 output domain-containing protein [Haloarculaceae archaeon H-GB11]